MSKHAMTADNYKQVISSKTAEDVKQVVYGMLRFSVSGTELYCVIGVMMFAGILSFCLKKDFRRKYVCLLAVSALLYLTYMAGMVFMYLFSMPAGEAVVLASSDRYRKTIFIVIYYLFAIAAVQCISDTVENYRGGGIWSRCICCVGSPLAGTMWTVCYHFYIKYRTGTSLV